MSLAGSSAFAQERLIGIENSNARSGRLRGRTVQFNLNIVIESV